MTESESKELEELRLYKKMHEGKALNRAFARLENLLENTHYDPIMHIRAFKTIADCLFCLREELGK